MAGGKQILLDKQIIESQVEILRIYATRFADPDTVAMDHDGMVALSRLKELVDKMINVLKSFSELANDDCNDIMKMVQDFTALDDRLSSGG